MTTYNDHEWQTFANVAPKNDEVAVVVTVVCQRCGDVRSEMFETEGAGRIDLSGVCTTADDR